MMKMRAISLILCAVLSVSVLIGGLRAKPASLNGFYAPLCDLPPSPVDQ